MKQYSMIQSKAHFNEFILVFPPDTVSINKTLNNFIMQNKGENEMTIKMDLIPFVGDRPERFVELKVKDSKVLEGSIKKGKVDYESEQITLQEYSRMYTDIINRVFPISYRNKIIEIKGALQ